MTQVIIAPRIENPLSDTETVISGGWFQIRPTSAYVVGSQWVTAVFGPAVPLTGVPVTVYLDPLVGVSYELFLSVPDGRNGRIELSDYRMITDEASPTPWEAFVKVGAPGAGPADPSDFDARLDALEAANPSGPATTLINISDMSAFMRTVNDDTSAAAALATLTAAPLASPALTGNPTAPTPTAGDNDTTIATTAFVTTAIGSGGITTSSPTFTGTTDLVNLDVSGTTAFAAGSIAQAAVANLVSDLAGKVSAASPTITGTADLVNLDVSGTAVFAAGSIAQAAVTNLATDLTAKAALASPTFTGTPAAPTAAAGTDTTQVATTAFVQDHTAWAYGIQPRCVWTGSAWPTRASVTPTGYTGAIEYWSPYDSAATAPTDRVLNDLWTRKRTT